MEQIDQLAKKFANRYAAHDPGRWCKTYHVARMLLIEDSPLSDWKAYIRVLREKQARVK